MEAYYSLILVLFTQFRTGDHRSAAPDFYYSPSIFPILVTYYHALSLIRDTKVEKKFADNEGCPSLVGVFSHK